MPYILLILANFHENPKPVTLSFPSSYGYGPVLAKLIIKLNESITRQMEVVFIFTSTFLIERHV